MNQKIEENIEEIVSLIKNAETYNGYKMSPSTHIRLHWLRGKLLNISDEEIDFYFERNNSNARIGMYKITLKCSKEVEDFIDEHR